MRTKYLPLHLPRDVYHRIEQAGHAEERDVLQQVRWILKRAVEAPRDDLASDSIPAGVAGHG